MGNWASTFYVLDKIYYLYLNIKNSKNYLCLYIRLVSQQNFIICKFLSNGQILCLIEYPFTFLKC